MTLNGVVKTEYRVSFDVICGDLRGNTSWQASEWGPFEALQDAVVAMESLHKENHRNVIIQQRVVITGEWEPV